jgi:hypothetical protein
MYNQIWGQNIEVFKCIVEAMAGLAGTYPTSTAPRSVSGTPLGAKVDQEVIEHVDEVVKLIDNAPVKRPAPFFERHSEGASYMYSGGNLDVHGISGRTNAAGILEFEVIANAELRATLGSGSEMFQGMMSTIGRENVRGIRAVWLPQGKMTSNYDSYMKALSSGMSKEQAVFETFTGKMAQRYNFTKVHEVKTDRHGIVTVLFGE